jgi:Tfp pilus assembly protein PilO
MPRRSIPKEKILLGIATILGIVVWFNLLWWPQWKRFGTLRKEIGSLKGEVVRLEQGLAQKKALEAEMAQLSLQLEHPHPTVLPEQQMLDLIGRITQLAKTTGVRLLSAKPKLEWNQLKVGPSGTLAMPLELKISCGYHALGTFLDRLESSERWLQLKELEIQGNAEDPWNHHVRLVFLAHLIPVPQKS